MPHEALLAQARHRQRDPAWRADYHATRPKVERKLAQGDKALVGNTGYRRFLADPKGEGFTIDPAKVEADAEFDGQFMPVAVLRLDLDYLA